jgi:hypothetical protein
MPDGTTRKALIFSGVLRSESDILYCQSINGMVEEIAKDLSMPGKKWLISIES